MAELAENPGRIDTRTRKRQFTRRLREPHGLNRYAIELVTDDFSLADLGGGIMSKGSLMDSIRSGRLRFDVIETIERSVRLYGPTAIVTGRTEMRGRFDQTAFAAQSRYTHVYVERDGKFYLAAAQGTPIV